MQNSCENIEAIKLESVNIHHGQMAGLLGIGQIFAQIKDKTRKIENETKSADEKYQTFLTEF